MISYNQIKTLLTNTNQLHLLRFWDELTNDEKHDFLVHLNGIDFEEATKIFKNAQMALLDEAKQLDNHMKPIPDEQFQSEESSSEEQLDKYNEIGLNAISDGFVGVLLLAGGQGTRLGVSYPKGMYSIGLPSGKSLFQVQAERIRKIEKLSERKTGQRGNIVWYIMTSVATRKTTENYLITNNFFGLKQENVILFDQGLFPCFDMKGRILLDEKNRVALSPNGNGGIYRALHVSGILKDMSKRKIRYIHVHSVDNILVRVADPIFIGYCIDKKADCGAKVVKKLSWSESVGVVCQVNGNIRVIEYSEITDSTSRLCDDKGNLVFNSASICNHFFSTEFLKNVNDVHDNKLKLHVAQKKIPFINEFGEKEKPDQVNGIKIEKFIFDAFPFSKHFVTWEVPRNKEFSALKNADNAGKDCPSTARNDLFSLHKIYVENAGGVVEGDVVEISPLLSYSGEDLKNIVCGKTFLSPVLLNENEEI